MSAIWGIIGRDNKAVDDLFAGMSDVMKQYQIDRVDNLKHRNAVFACGHAYITKEAHNDISPIYDDETGTLFTADAFLTNRESIIEAIKSNADEGVKYEEMGDAYLCFWAYKTLGTGFIDKLRGSFAIAIFDCNNQKVSLYSDHLSKRYLAYYVGEDFICFSSTYGPIKVCLGDRLKLNERCICEYYQSNSPKSFKSDDITVYDEVYHVNCAEIVNIDVITGKRTKNKYYEFGKEKRNYKKIADEEFKKIFIDTYRKSVKSILRSEGETGIMLSGGLDSSSVAALAAEELAKYNKNLYSYTTIPASGFEYTNNQWVTENEKPQIEAQKEMWPNLITNYITGDEGCLFSGLDDNTELLECPVKAGNIDNIARMFKAAKDDGCKILTGGANGNATVSFGNILVLMSYYFGRLRFISAYKEMASFCMINKISRKTVCEIYFRTLKNSLKSIVSYKLSSLIKDDYCKKYHLKRIGRKSVYECGTDAFATKKQRKNFIANPYYSIHEGMYYTYMSLKYGVLYIDPTEDIDMMEFCLNIPMKFQVKEGVDRRTIRGYMKEMLPECIISKKVGRGSQAADMVYRINRDWNTVKNIIIDDLSTPELKKYMDAKKIDDLMGKVTNCHKDIELSDIFVTYAACSLGAFLRKYNKKDIKN